MAPDPAIVNGSTNSKEETIMMITNVSQRNAIGLPQALRTAQDAIHFPEVQEMLRRLSEYRLGICMPHMHEETGGFQPLPDAVMQIESGLEVSFQSAEEIATRQSNFSLWHGFGAEVRRQPPQVAKWSGRKDLVIQNPRLNIRCQKEINSSSSLQLVRSGRKALSADSVKIKPTRETL